MSIVESYQTVQIVAPWLLPVLVFVFGACIGSFLNVCIYRIPKNESVVHPRSHCACGALIHWYDNIPILSWLLLRGRARCCGGRFSARYPAVELLTGLLFFAAWMEHPPAVALAGMVLIAMLIAATFIDIDHMIIPDRFSIGGFLVGIAVAAIVPALHLGSEEQTGIFALDSIRSGTIALHGAFIGSALLLWIAILAEKLMKREAMGFGDVKLMGAIGAFLGWQGAVFAIFGGAVAGCILYALGLIWKRVSGQPRSEQREQSDNASVENASCQCGQGNQSEAGIATCDLTAEESPAAGEIPFGPSLAIGAVVYFLWLHEATDAYFASGLFRMLM